MKSLWSTKKGKMYDKWKQYWFDTHPRDIALYSWDYLFSGGKQIRPTLFCELQHYFSPDSNEIQYDLAFAIECIHVASIVLDDTPWMDNANLRRGKVTLHKQFTPKKACLIAYDLLYLAINIWNTSQPSTINKEEWKQLLKGKLQRLMIGQWYDLDKKGDLVELASLKTGVLFELVAETVAVLSNLDRTFWRQWGNNLGVLFQWMDDWDDREEDKIQENRNAFNENYEITLYRYYYLWDSLVLGIGKNWFQSDFGKYMESYFIEMEGFPKRTFAIREKELSLSVQLSYPEKFEIPQELRSLEKEKEKPNPKSKKYRGGFEFINGKDMIKYLWMYIEQHDSCPDYRYLWSKQESEWDTIVSNQSL